MVKTTAIHASKLSTSGDDEKVSLQNKHADSLISVTLAEHEGSDADLGGASLHTTDNITMQFPDDTEIAKSSLGATQEISLAQAEAGKQNNKSEVIVLNHVDITQKQPIIEADKLQSGKESSYIRDTEAGQVQLQEDIPSTPVTTQFPENEDTPKPSTHRTSKVRFDMDQIATQSLQILSIDTPNEQDEDEDEGNYYTSGSESSMPHPHIEAHSLEAELERSLQTSRRESEGSSESDSELVDWQELDRTEEEEKRDGATGEVCQILVNR